MDDAPHFRVEYNSAKRKPQGRPRVYVTWPGEEEERELLWATALATTHPVTDPMTVDVTFIATVEINYPEPK